MAKSMSLMGKADATLVGASFREAAANVPADLKGVYDKREEAFRTFSAGIDKLYKDITFEEREEVKKTKELVNATDGDLNALGNDFIFDITQNIVEQYKTAIKNAETKSEKAKLRMKYNALTGKLKNAQSLIDSGIDNVQNLQFNSTEDRKFFNSVLTDLKENTNVTSVSYDEGKNDYVFTDPNRPDQKITMKELFNKVGYKDIKIATDINTVLNGVAGGKDTYKDKGDAQKRVQSTVLDKLGSNQDIISAFTDKNFNGMDGLSVDDLLKNRGKSDLSKEIYTTLQSIDLNLDGEVDDKDATLATPENYVKLVEAINGDTQLKKEIIARTVGNVSGGNAYDIMKRNTTKPPKETTPNAALIKLQIQEEQRIKSETQSKQKFDNLLKKAEADLDTPNTIGQIIFGDQNTRAQLEKGDDGNPYWYLYGGDDGSRLMGKIPNTNNLKSDLAIKNHLFEEAGGLFLTKEEKNKGVTILNGQLYIPGVKNGKKGYLPYTRK